MRFLSTPFLLTLLFIFGSFSSPIYAVDIVDNISHVCIEITDKLSPLKSKIIDNVLKLRASLTISPQSPIPEENAHNGYLLINMTREYLCGLIENKEGILITAYQEQSLVGYILLTDISGFKELYENESIGFIKTDIDLANLDTLRSHPKVGYIEEIGVKFGYSKKRIGTLLINMSKEIKPDGLVADVFVDPLKNDASLQFFAKQGFEKSGTLHQHPRANFPYSHRTQVFFWNIDTKDL